MKEQISVKTVYIVDQNSKFVGIASVPDTEENSVFITTPPPTFNSSTENLINTPKTKTKS